METPNFLGWITIFPGYRVIFLCFSHGFPFQTPWGPPAVPISVVRSPQATTMSTSVQRARVRSILAAKIGIWFFIVDGRNPALDGWKPSKIMGCLPPINWCRFSSTVSMEICWYVGNYVQMHQIFNNHGHNSLNAMELWKYENMHQMFHLILCFQDLPVIDRSDSMNQ